MIKFKPAVVGEILEKLNYDMILNELNNHIIDNWQGPNEGPPLGKQNLENIFISIVTRTLKEAEEIFEAMEKEGMIQPGNPFQKK